MEDDTTLVQSQSERDNYAVRCDEEQIQEDERYGAEVVGEFGKLDGQEHSSTSRPKRI
jgi:hypothetical protein